MSRELLKRAVLILHDHFDGVNCAEQLLNDIEVELAKPDPEPVAYIMTHPENRNILIFADDKGTWPERYIKTPIYAEPVDQSARIAELEAELAQAYKTVDENLVRHQQLAALQDKREILSRLKPIGYIPAYAARIIHNEGSWDAFHHQGS